MFFILNDRPNASIALRCRVLFATFFIVLFGFFSHAQASEKDADSYTTLAWAELIPENWDRPIILPDPSNEDTHHHVDKASLVKALAKQNIKIPGYMVPVKFEKNVVSEFILVPFLEHHVRAHIHHDPNQMVYVYLEQALAIENPYTPLWVRGNMRLQSVETDEGPSGYIIKRASIEPYIF